MKIAIVAAMSEELKYFVDKIENVNTKNINNYTFYKGRLFNHDLVLVVSGIGKVFAGVLLTTLFDHFNVDLVINVGSAGGIVGKTNLGNVVIGDRLFYGDVDLTSTNKYAYGQLPRLPRYFEGKQVEINERFPFTVQKADILTSDSFINELEKVQPLLEKYFSAYNIVACEMETAAFAQVCYFFNKDFIAIRGISDIIGRSDDSLAFTDENLEYASLNSCLVVESILKTIS